MRVVVNSSALCTARRAGLILERSTMRISRRTFFVALFCSVFFGLLLPAQGARHQKPAPGKAKGESQGRPLKNQESQQKPVIDKVKIESHVRRLNMWPPQIKISVGEPEP